jgi:xylulokinase
MGEPYFLGIDIGTYESKGVVIDGQANIVAYAVAPHEMEVPKPGYAEHDAEKTWWADFCRISRRLLGESGLDPRKISAVGCSTIAPCCLPVDAENRPLRKAILYGVDVRAEKEIRYIEDYYGADRIFQKCGTAVSSQSAAAKILWIKNNEPDVYAGAAKFITGATYITAKLTGNYVIDRYTAASWTPAYDVENEDWEDDVSLFCRRDQLAECRWTHEPAGEVQTGAATETGLAPGTPVVTGTADAAAEALSVGVLQPGEMMLMYGSSLFIIHVVDRFMSEPRLCSGPYLFPGTYALTAGMSTAGTLTRWYRDQFAREAAASAEKSGRNVFEVLAEAAADIPPGSDGLIVLPYFSGERTPINDPSARGVIFGLNLRHTREHIYNACLEGVGYGIAQHIGIIGGLGAGTTKIMAVGGGAKHPRWLQIVSDICGLAQQTAAVNAGAAYGDALLAALGVGYYKSVDELRRNVKIERVFAPDNKNRHIYGKYLGYYTSLYEKTKDIMHGLSEPIAPIIGA